MNIVNIMNFVRGCEPRDLSIDLQATTAKQIEISRDYGFKTTFLFQYDAFTKKEFSSLDLSGGLFERGLWLEIDKTLTEAAEIVWTGRKYYSWDWHCHCGMIVGYTAEEKKKIIDLAFYKFKEIFGCYPSTVGSWVLDAFSVGYMSEKYKISCTCICKEQFGTDGYTLQGGFYNHAYYPSVNNILCPASSAEKQINTPVFRLLGSDPIYQYDCSLGNFGTDVFTLEPVGWQSGIGGGSAKWTDWYFDTQFSNRNAETFNYIQA